MFTINPSRCGKKRRMHMVKNEKQSDGTPRMQKIREKAVTIVAAIKSATEKYILHALVIVSALIVLISGFFVKYEYIPMEQLQTYSQSASGSTQVDQIINDMFEEIKYEQSMFYPFGALFVGEDAVENAKEIGGLQTNMDNASMGFLAQKGDVVLKLGLLLSTTDYDADEAMKLIDEIRSGASGIYSDVNLMRLEKLQVKNQLLLADESVEASMTELYQRQLNDLTVRDAVLSAGSLIYIYLQIVAIIFIVVEGLAILKRKTVSARFFAFYMPGIFALFAISQLTAVGLNGAAVACCAVAAIFCGLYALGKVWVTQKGAVARRGLIGLFGSLCLLISACLFGSGMYSFGVRVNNIGAALGFNCYNGHVFAEGEINSAVMVNYLPLAAFHIIALALTIVSLVRMTVSAVKGEKCGWKLPAVASAVTLAGYVAYKVCVLCGAVDLISLGGQMLVIIIFNVLAALAAYVSSSHQENVAEKSEAQEVAQDEVTNE